jgi:signal peptidase II
VKRSLILLLLISGGVLALDFVTKRWATEALSHRPPVEFLGEYVRFTYTRNSGVAFGLGAGFKFPYAIFSIAAAMIILYLFLSRRVIGLGREIALSLILGGALGNLVDRLSSGEVVDFIEIGWDRWHWPVFNVADSAVSVGVVLFAIVWSHRPDHGHAEPAPAIATDPAVIPLEEPYDASHGARIERGGAARSLPGDGADRPVA